MYRIRLALVQRPTSIKMKNSIFPARGIPVEETCEKLNRLLRWFNLCIMYTSENLAGLNIIYNCTHVYIYAIQHTLVQRLPLYKLSIIPVTK